MGETCVSARRLADAWYEADQVAFSLDEVLHNNGVAAAEAKLREALAYTFRGGPRIDAALVIDALAALVGGADDGK